MHPVRGAGLGRRRRFLYHKSQAVRPAGKRLRESDSAEGFVGVCQWVTGGLALGMGAEMDGSLQVFTPPWSPKGGNHPSAVAGAARHCSGQPDGAARFNSLCIILNA